MLKAPRILLTAAVFALLPLFLSAPPVRATSFIPRPFPEVVEDAPVIVRGRIGGKAVDWVIAEDGSKRIYTFYDLQISEVFKGAAPTGRVKIREMGGEKDGKGMVVSGTAQFETGEDVVVLLGERNNDNSYDVRGLMMGKLMLKKNSKGEEILAGPAIDQALMHAHEGHSGEERGSQNDTPPEKEWSLDSLRQLIRDQGDRPQSEAVAKPTEFQSPSPSPLASSPAPEASEQAAPQLQPSSGEEEQDPRGFGFLPWIGLALGGVGAVWLLRRKR